MLLDTWARGFSNLSLSIVISLVQVNDEWKKKRKKGRRKKKRGTICQELFVFFEWKERGGNRSCFIRNVIDLVSPRIQVFLECGVHVESEGTAISSDRWSSKAFHLLWTACIADKSRENWTRRWKITLRVAITHFLNEYLEIYLISSVDQPYKLGKIQLLRSAFTVENNIRVHIYGNDFFSTRIDVERPPASSTDATP